MHFHCIHFLQPFPRHTLKAVLPNFMYLAINNKHKKSLVPRLKIHNHAVLRYTTDTHNKYWKELSDFIKNKFGTDTVSEHEKVKEILQASFDFFVSKFRSIILRQKNVSLFLYAFWLNEESFKLLVEFRDGKPYQQITDNEFSSYRRSLKLIIEQGCDIDFPKGKYPSAVELLAFDEIIIELLYLADSAYNFADHIAYQKMVNEAHQITFDEFGYLETKWQHHYEEVYNILMSEHKSDYEVGVYDRSGELDLKNAIEESFGISYAFAGHQIFHIKKHFGGDDPCQTISPEVLPQNLVAHSGINLETATAFYDGLTLSRSNKLPIEEAIYKPHSIQRYMFRPIIIYSIAGEPRALVGIEKYSETIYVLATNAVQWDTLSPEWLTNTSMRKFMTKKGNEHDSILEDKIEVIINEKEHLYCRNIESFKQVGHKNLNIINLCGEIDFIIINQNINTIYVVDVKYNKARYEGIGYSMDNSNFIEKYEKQLSKKVGWIKDNLLILEIHLKIANNLPVLDLTNYIVKGAFFINTPTFYMFNGAFKTYPLARIAALLDGSFDYTRILIENDNFMGFINHPYFNKPMVL